MKLSLMEKRLCDASYDANAAVRWAEEVCLRRRWHLSETHIEALLAELCKEDKNDMNMSYGDWMFINDDTGSQHAAVKVHTWIQEQTSEMYHAESSFG